MCIKGDRVEKPRQQATLVKDSPCFQKAIAQGMLPENVKDFYAYKVVKRDYKIVGPNKTKKILCSPVRSDFPWEPGKRKAQGIKEGNDAGIYCFIAKPNTLIMAFDEKHAVIRLKCKVKNIREMGPDEIGPSYSNGMKGAFKGMAVVMTEVELSSTDHRNALSGKAQKMEVRQIIQKTKKKVAAAAKKVKKKKKAIKKVYSNIKVPSKKTSKRSTKKTPRKRNR